MQSTFSFSPLDEIMPAIEETALLTFAMPEGTSKENAVSVLMKGLETMLSHRPFLNGRIVRMNKTEAAKGLRPGSLGMEISRKETQPLPIVFDDWTVPNHPWQHSYETLVKAGMPSSLLEREVVGMPQTMEQRPLKIKDSRVEQPTFDGGSCSDDTSHLLFRGQRSEIDYEKLKRRSELWEMLGLDWRPKERSWSILAAELTSPRSVRTCIFSLDVPTLAKLKDEATDDTNKASAYRISTNDALIAFLWRGILRVRAACGRQMFSGVDETMHMVAMNARQQLSPPVPLSHIGNVVLYAMARLPISLITAPGTSLATISRALRQSLDACRSPELFRDAIDLAASIPDVQQLGLAFPTWLAENLVTSSISGIPFYEVDFGGVFGGSGKPDFFRYPKGGFEGLCFVMPKQRNGSIELFLSMEASQMAVLMEDKDFIKYAKFVSE